MILDNLNDYYQLKVQEGDSSMPRRYWSEEKVAWEFRLDADGKLVSVISYANDEMKTKRRSMIVPEHGACTSGIKPFFLCDRAAYFLGRDAKRGVEKLERSCQLHHEVLDNLDDPAAKAVLSFLDSQSGVELLSEEILEELDKGSWIVFKYIPDEQLVHERPAIIKAWESYSALSSANEMVQCAITGEKGAPAILFPHISGFPGAKAAKVMLVSFNRESFCSYGKKKKDKLLNASISEAAAFNVGSALKYLVKTEGHRTALGNGQILFWTEKAQAEDDAFLSIVLGMDDLLSRAREDEKLREEIQTVLESLRAGKQSVPFSRSTRYFVLGIAPHEARISVKLFEVGTLGGLEASLQLFLKDTEIVATGGIGSLEPRSIFYYVNQMAAFGKASNVPDVFLNAVTNAMLKGRPFPNSFFQTLLSRTRIDKGFSRSGTQKNDAMGYRAAAFKACLVRKKRTLERSLTVALNSENKNIGYLLGRLFAAMEKAQADAIPGANATIRDRYMGSASATPARVFPQLLKMCEHHISKAEYGMISDKRIQEIMAHIDSFPKTLGYDDQGQFFIGYYHQKSAIYAGKQVKTSEETREND